MAQYKIGSVTALHNSTTISGVGTSWLANVSPSDVFTLIDNQIFYEVASVTSDTQLVLTAAYQLPSTLGTGYQDAIYTTLTTSNVHGLTGTLSFDIAIDGSVPVTVSVNTALGGVTIIDMINYVDTLLVGAGLGIDGNSIRILSDLQGSTSAIAITNDTLFSALPLYSSLSAANTLISGASYAVSRDFTPNYALPYPVKGDLATAAILKRALLDIDTLLGTGATSLPYLRSDMDAVASGELTMEDSSLSAISSIVNSNSVVDVFVYNTAKDSDGGAWRKKTSATSWYNETLNTATRGATKDFPAIVLIVAETDKITIYDATDSTIPMWMVYNRPVGAGNLLALWGHNGATVISDATSISAKNGHIILGLKSVGSIPTSNYTGVIIHNFANDSCSRISGTASNIFGINSIGGITLKNRHAIGLVQLSQRILNSFAVNDVAITVLPNAPIDSTTGLPIPTIYVATDAGLSRIADDGSISSVVPSSGLVVVNYIHTTDGIVYYGANSTNSSVIVYSQPVGSALNTYTPNLSISSAPSGIWSSTNIVLRLANYNQYWNIEYLHNAARSNDGFFPIRINSKEVGSSLYANITNKYNSGWMYGDIAGSWLASTDSASLIGLDTVVNGNFTTGITSWIDASEGTGSASWDALGHINLNTGVDSNNEGISYQIIPTVIGKSYTTSHTQVVGSSVLQVGNGIGSSSLGQSNVGESITFIATSTTTYVTLRNFNNVNGTSSIDNVAVKIADPDRSYKNNGLQVNGTITRTPVATGSDLVSYSGFSAVNYLEQPYNSDLDFGTGDFYMMAWVKSTSGNILDRGDGSTNTNRLQILVSNSGIVSLNIAGVTLTGTIDTSNRFVCIIATRVNGNTFLYINGTLDVSGVATGSITAPYSTKVGVSQTLGSPLQGSIALMRIGAGAPSSEQIKEIYETEKKLFEDNASCTLTGTLTTSIAYDEDTRLHHVASTNNLDTFSNLVRVSTEAGIYTSVSADNGIILKGA